MIKEGQSMHFFSFKQKSGYISFFLHIQFKILYLKVVDGVNGIHVEENQPISVEIKSTLPIGCIYQEG